MTMLWAWYMQRRDEAPESLCMRSKGTILMEVNFKYRIRLKAAELQNLELLMTYRGSFKLVPCFLHLWSSYLWCFHFSWRTLVSHFMSSTIWQDGLAMIVASPSCYCTIEFVIELLLTVIVMEVSMYLISMFKPHTLKKTRRICFISRLQTLVWVDVYYVNGKPCGASRNQLCPSWFIIRNQHLHPLQQYGHVITLRHLSRSRIYLSATGSLQFCVRRKAAPGITMWDPHAQRLCQFRDARL
jgi:hypothetical protein